MLNNWQLVLASGVLRVKNDRDAETDSKPGVYIMDIPEENH